MRLLREMSLIFAAAGLFGFLACGAVKAAAQWRLAGDSSLSKVDEKRAAEITVKGLTGYVEAEYADRFRRADNFANYFWLLGVPGILGFALLRKSQ